MKKITLLFTLLFVNFFYSQNYTFLKTNDAYVELVNPISINNGEIWDDIEYDIILPFNFVINGLTFNSLTVFDSFIAFDATSNIIQIATPYGNDLVDRGLNSGTSLSPLNYKIVGNIGSRIAKIQYKNCGAFDDENLSMFVNFQIWFYENSNIIEFHYGASSVSDPSIFYIGETGGIVGVLAFDTDLGESPNGIFLTGPVSVPSTTSQLGFVNGTPPNSTVYRFTPTNLATPSFETKNFVFYPNPANDYLNILVVENDLNYIIQDISGKTVLYGKISANQNQIAIASLASGMYFVEIESYSVQKFIKK